MSALPENLILHERGWLSSNNLLCLGESPALIDTGHVKHADETVRQVRQALGDQPLADIAHTHLHSDHCGGNAALQKTSTKGSLPKGGQRLDHKAWTAKASKAFLDGLNKVTAAKP